MIRWPLGLPMLTSTPLRTTKLSGMLAVGVLLGDVGVQPLRSLPFHSFIFFLGVMVFTGGSGAAGGAGAVLGAAAGAAGAAGGVGGGRGGRRGRGLGRGQRRESSQGDGKNDESHGRKIHRKPAGDRYWQFVLGRNTWCIVVPLEPPELVPPPAM